VIYQIVSMAVYACLKKSQNATMLKSISQSTTHTEITNDNPRRNTGILGRLRSGLNI